MKNTFLIMATYTSFDSLLNSLFNGVFVFKRSLAICHVIQGHFQWFPIDLEFHFQNCKHFPDYSGFHLLTIVSTKKTIVRIFVYLFRKLQRQK